MKQFSYMFDDTPSGLTYEYIPDNDTLIDALAKVLSNYISASAEYDARIYNGLVNMIEDLGLHQDLQFCERLRKELEATLYDDALEYVEKHREE